MHLLNADLNTFTYLGSFTNWANASNTLHNAEADKNNLNGHTSDVTTSPVRHKTLPMVVINVHGKENKLRIYTKKKVALNPQRLKHTKNSSVPSAVVTTTTSRKSNTPKVAIAEANKQQTLSDRICAISFISDLLY